MRARRERRPTPKEGRYVAIARKKHAPVAAAVLLEQHLLDHGGMTDQEFMEFMHDKGVAPQVQERFVDILQSYRTATEKADHDEIKMLRAAGFDETEEPDPTEFGRAVFFAATGMKPVGNPAFQRFGPALSLTCDNRKDYFILSRKRRFSDLKPGTSGKALFQPSRLVFFLNGIQFIVTPLILLNSQHGEDDLQEGIRHEVQHYIDDKILKGYTLVRPEEKKTSVEQHIIKQEIIAYIRQGDNEIGEVIKLGSGSYSKFLRFMDQPERERTLRAITGIDVQLERLDSVFSSEEGRAFLAYYLVDAPIEEFPALLQGLHKYSQELLRVFQEYDVDAPESAPEGESQAMGAWQQYAARKEELKKQLLLHPSRPATDLRAQLDELQRQHQEAIARF